MPATATAANPPGELDTVNVSERGPVAIGTNVTVTVQLAPGASVLQLLTSWKEAPPNAALIAPVVVVPVFVIVTL